MVGPYILIWIKNNIFSSYNYSVFFIIKISTMFNSKKIIEFDIGIQT